MTQADCMTDLVMTQDPYHMSYRPIAHMIWVISKILYEMVHIIWVTWAGNLYDMDYMTWTIKNGPYHMGYMGGVAYMKWTIKNAK